MVTKLVRELKSAVNFFFKAFYRERLELFLHCFDKIPKNTLSNTPEVSFTRTTATILHNNTIQKKKNLSYLANLLHCSKTSLTNCFLF